jgi:hypothetical protein
MKPKKKNYAGVMVSLFIAFIMITSIAGYIFSDTSVQQVKYNGIKFVQNVNGWNANIQGKQYFFSYEPNQLDRINISESIKFGNLVMIDVTYDVNSTYAERIAESIYELDNILIQKGIFVRKGFTVNNSFNLPILNCEDATPAVPVILFTYGNDTLITNLGNCIILEAADMNSFLPITDKLAYRIIGVI